MVKLAMGGLTLVFASATATAALLLFQVINAASRSRVRAILLGKLLELPNDGSCGGFALLDAKTRLCTAGFSYRGVAQLIARSFVGTHTAEPEWIVH